MATSEMFERMLAPGRIGTLTLRNRIVMPPMGVNYGTSDGFVTQRSLDYYEARAKGGVGAIIVEFTCVEFPRGKGHDLQLGIDDDKFLPGLSALAGAIKRHGARAIIQLHHAGREAHVSGMAIEPVAPSAIRSINPKMHPPRALAVAEIRALAERFVEAAARAERAGFDGIEVHAAHGYLLSQFLSPLCNQRDDEYGGPLENRARIVVEIVRGIRQRLGKDYPLGVRISADEFLPGGITPHEACATARLLEEAGADVLHVSAGGLGSPKSVMIGTPMHPPGHLLHLPALVKQVLRVPVIGVGLINTPAVAEAALRDGKCDFVAMGRALIADPELPNKVAGGRLAEIRPCTACMHCLHSVGFEDNTPMACAVNPAAGRERELAWQPARTRKKVLVVGGGPAGMEAARTAALRGHRVTLYEQRKRLGGLLIAASAPPYKGELDALRAYYVDQLARAGVEVRLAESPDAATIGAAKPDAVVVATGGEPLLPPLPGLETASVALAEEVLTGKATAGARVVVIGGGMVGCETAEYLAAQGKRVAVVEMTAAMAADMSPTVRGLLLRRLLNAGVQLLTETRAEAIEGEGVTVVGPDGQRQALAADTVVLATGARANGHLGAALAGAVAELHVIGNARQPRRILEAIHEGAAAGMAV